MTTSRQLSRSLRYQHALGPFFANAGFTNWTLYLTPDEIVCVSLGIWLSVKAGLLAGVSQKPAVAAGAYSAHPDPLAPGVLVDDGHPKWRRYRIADLDSIVLKRCLFTANEIRIARIGEKAHVYGIGDRPYTQECRTVFGRLYSSLYREQGF